MEKDYSLIELFETFDKELFVVLSMGKLIELLDNAGYDVEAPLPRKNISEKP